MGGNAESSRIVRVVVAAALCVVAAFALVRVLGDSDPNQTIAKVSSVAFTLLLFSPICLAGVVLTVRRPTFAWLGYATTAIAFVAFVLLTKEFWEEDGFPLFSGDWELSGTAIVVAIACGQISLLLSWARSGTLVRGLGYTAASVSAVIAVLVVLGILAELSVSDRIYGALAILYLLPVALLPLFTLGRGRSTEPPS